MTIAIYVRGIGTGPYCSTLTLERPPPFAPACDACGQPANLDVDGRALCTACTVELVEEARNARHNATVIAAARAKVADELYQTRANRRLRRRR